MRGQIQAAYHEKKAQLRMVGSAASSHDRHKHAVTVPNMVRSQEDEMPAATVKSDECEGYSTAASTLVG